MKGFFFLNGGFGSTSGSSAGYVSPSSVTPCQPPRFLYTIAGVKSGSRMWPRRPMVTHSSPSTSKRYTGVEYTLSAFGFFAPKRSAIFCAASFFSVTTSFTRFPPVFPAASRGPSSFTRLPRWFINVCGDGALRRARRAVRARQT